MIYSEYNDEIKNEIYKNNNYIAGIDEVGRGPLAGPVVTCAVIMKKDSHIEGITDSKKLTRKKMISLADEIKKECICFSFGYKNHKMIDGLNIKQATLLAMKEAVESLEQKPDIILIDAEKIDTDIKQLSIVKGDLYEYAISCASILAKVRRDDIMINFSKIYPNYSFESNKGYGTKKHYDALEKYGPCPIHRQTFLRKFYEKQMSFI